MATHPAGSEIIDLDRPCTESKTTLPLRLSGSEVVPNGVEYQTGVQLNWDQSLLVSYKDFFLPHYYKIKF